MPGAVVFLGNVSNHFIRIFGSGFHRHHAGDLLADSRIEEALKEPGLEGGRNDLFQDLRGAGEEFVFDGLLLASAPRGQIAEWEQRFHDRNLPGGRLISLVGDVQAVQPAGDEVGDVPVRDGVHLVEARLVLELRIALGDGPPLKLHEPQTPLAGDLDREVLPRGLHIPNAPDRLTKNPAVVPAAQTAIGREDQQRDVLRHFRLLEQRVAERQVRLRQVRDDLIDLLGIRGRFRSAVHGLLESRRGDEFHRPRDLADVADGFAPFDECTRLGHG